jgi:hypothetical protein
MTLSNRKINLTDHKFTVRDRLVLYARGVDLSVTESLELALLALKRVGEDFSLERAMDELKAILTEKGLNPGENYPLKDLFWSPPLNRSFMTTEKK